MPGARRLPMSFPAVFAALDLRHLVSHALWWIPSQKPYARYTADSPAFMDKLYWNWKMDVGSLQSQKELFANIMEKHCCQANTTFDFHGEAHYAKSIAYCEFRSS